MLIETATSHSMIGMARWMRLQLFEEEYGMKMSRSFFFDVRTLLLKVFPFMSMVRAADKRQNQS
jgi:hypothetical protein